MKTKKMFLLFAAFIFAAVAIYNIHLAQTQNLGDISLADIAVMVKADTEIPPTITCDQFAGPAAQCWKYDLNFSPPCRWTGYQYDFCIAN